MARVKNEYGLTLQEERFCKYYVNQYANLDEDGSDVGIAVEAYRRAYNCKSDAKRQTHQEKASRLINKGKIRARIAQLREAVGKVECIECAEIVRRNVVALNVDPLELLVFDDKLGKYRIRFMHEIRKEIRDVIPYKINNRGIVIPDIDRNVIQDRLIRILGYEASKKQEVGVTLNNEIIGDDWFIGVPGEEYNDDDDD